MFGGRLCRLLADEPGVHLLVAGRSLAKARAFCGALPPGAARTPLALDRAAITEAVLREIAPDAAIDASGPFQVYGAEPYRVVEACIAAKIDYLDLADGAAFVRGVSAFDARAKAAGVSVLSGVSTCPALTSAAVRRLTRGWDRIDSISGGIAPSPWAGVGLSVIRAIASYAGKPVALRRDGRDASGAALVEDRRWTIAPPGRLPLKPIRFSLVEAPELTLLPAAWPGLRDVWFGAGPTPAVLHRLLSLMAGLVRLRLLPSLSFGAPLFHWAINTLRWGERRGGMVVEAEGVRDGAPIRRSWHLIAEGDRGPNIPAMAAEALVRRRLAGAKPASGARACLEELELEDFEASFSRIGIQTGVREPQEDRPLYRRTLDEAYETLPLPLRRMHDRPIDTAAEGRATVERGANPLARLAGAIIGFPPAAADVPVRVEFRVRDGVETWTRAFGARSFSSSQEEGRGAAGGLLVERFGPMSIGMALVAEPDRLRLVMRRFTVFGVPMPLWLGPRSDTWEQAVDGRFNFHVDLSHPLTGLIVRYRGWLEPQPM